MAIWDKFNRRSDADTPSDNTRNGDDSVNDTEGLVRVEVGKNLSIKVNVEDIFRSSAYKKTVKDMERLWDLEKRRQAIPKRK